MQTFADKKPKVVIRLSHMGDVALITGVLSHWNETRCDSFVVVTREGNAPLLANHPAVQEVIGVKDDELKGAAWVRTARRLAARFNEHPLIDLHGTLRSRILSLIWKGPVHRYPKFGLTRRLYDRTHADRFRKILEATNVTQRYAMAYGEKPPRADSLIPRLYFTQAEQEAARAALAPVSEEKPLVALHPYATHPAKQWPRQHWHALTELLTAAGYDWFVIGRDEESLFQDHERDFTNKTNLRETCALMARAQMLVTADSGPMHLGCGVGTPVTALFGPTAKVWGFYPAGADDTVLELDIDCRPCSLHGAKNCPRGFECLAAISPQTVIETVQAKLG